MIMQHRDNNSSIRQIFWIYVYVQKIYAHQQRTAT